MINDRMNKARMILATISGMAAMIAGVGGHYHADHQTRPSKTRGRKRKNRYGASLLRHFDNAGINWSAKGTRK